jgi:hypothetical protein
MHWQQGGERKVEKSCIASLEPISRAKGELVHFFCIFGFLGCGLLGEIDLTGFGNRSDRFGGTDLTGLCPGLALVQGELAYVQGEFLYALVVCALCLSMVLSRMCQVVALA